MSYDASVHSGCVVCRREAGQPSVMPGPGTGHGKPVGASGAPANAGIVVAAISTPLVLLMALATYFTITLLLDVREELDVFIEPVLMEAAANGWSDEAVARHASPGYLLELESSAAAGPLDELRNLGPIQRYDGVETFNVQSGGGGGGTAMASVEVAFGSGERTLSVGLERIESRWYLGSLGLASP